MPTSSNVVVLAALVGLPVLSPGDKPDETAVRAESQMKYLSEEIYLKGAFRQEEGRHISRNIILFMILLSMASTTLAIEPLMLGQGKTDNVINLDAGARGGAYAPHFGSGGFVTPESPQPMVLSPGILVHQSQKLRDESGAIRQETSDLLNQTRDLAENVRRLEASAHENASLAKRSLEETNSVYNRTRISARRIETLVKRGAYGRDFGPFDAAMNAGELPALSSQVEMLAERLDLLERKIASLQAGTKSL